MLGYFLKEERAKKNMNYFITGTVDYWTSAIEISEMQRLKIFDQLKQPSCIVEMQYNYDRAKVIKNFHLQDRLINLYQYYQQLPFTKENDNDKLRERFLRYDGYGKDETIKLTKSQLIINNQKRINVLYNADSKRISYFEYFDKYGRPTHTVHIDEGCLSYTDYFDDNGHKVVRTYYNAIEQPTINIYYHWNAQSKKSAVFSCELITPDGVSHVFDRVEDFRAYFLDDLIANDSYPVLYADRSDIALEAFEKMQHWAPRFQMFHASYTFSGKPVPVDGLDKVELYEHIPGMYKRGEINGIISSTKKEAKLAGQYYHTHSYALPVYATDIDTINHPVPFSHRKKDQIIAVARIDNVKQLDHIVSAVIQLKQRHPKIDLKIYGYESEENNYEAPKLLKKIIKKHHAENYIHLCKYQQSLKDVYQTAQLEILTSKTEGFAIALMEAQEYGCPVISYDINYGPSEIIQNHKSGILIKPNDKKALIRNMDYLLSHQDVLANYSKNAPQAVKKYTINHLARRWKHFLKKENIYLNPDA